MLDREARWRSFPPTLGPLDSFGKLQLVALASILIVTGINCLAVKVSGGVASVLSGIKIALVLVVGVGAFLLARGADWSHLLMVNGNGACEGVSAAARVGFWRLHRGDAGRAVGL